MRRCSPSYFPWPLGVLVAFLAAGPLAFAGGADRPLADKPFADFLEWVEAYLSADDEARGQMAPEGERLAEKRRPGFETLMEKKPKEAAKAVVPAERWKKLPASVREHLEQPIQGEGSLQLVVLDDFKRGVSRHDHFLTLEGRRYRTFLAVDNGPVPINQPLRIEGFCLGGRILLTAATPAL